MYDNNMGHLKFLFEGIYSPINDDDNKYKINVILNSVFK